MPSMPLATDGAALVTGASRGIGLAIARALAAAGRPVFLTGKSPARLERACALLAEEGGRVAGVAQDLRAPGRGGLSALLERAEAELGPLGVLVNNAGTAPSMKFESTTPEVLDEVLDLQVRVPFALIRGALAGMRARGGGCIVQLASMAGLKGYALVAAYTAAKHAMLGMTRALALELEASPVRTCAVCPGFVETDITRGAAAAIARHGGGSMEQMLSRLGRLNACGRLLTTEEVAEVVRAICEDDGTRYPNGSIVQIDDLPPVLSR